jgi:hypothetical protein
MNQGNALVGFLLLAALATVYPVAAAIIGGLILLEVLIPRVLPAGVRTLRNIARLLRHWRAVPLAQKNKTRATFGGFLLALTAGAALYGNFPPLALAAAGGFGMLYLTAGVIGSHGARFDFLSLFWWGIGALGCAAALLHLKGVSELIGEGLALLAAAGLVACVLRVGLIVRPPPGARLPDPSTVPGMPMAGPALQKAAHAAINRRKV